MRNRLLPLLTLSVLAASPLLAQSAADERQTVVDYLSKKPFTGAASAYADADIAEAAVPEEVRQALSALGASHYALLRNEIVARRGYRFSDPLLEDLFHRAAWYRYDPAFDFSKLADVERRNMDFIKSAEDAHDYGTAAQWLNRSDRWPYVGDKQVYVGRDLLFAEMPPGTTLALNHLETTPAAVLRQEIAARHGAVFADKTLQKVFEGTSWYKKGAQSPDQAAQSFNDNEKANVELLKLVEWSEAQDSVSKITLPADTTAVPMIGYGAVYVRAIPHAGQSYYFASPVIYDVLQADASSVGDHGAAAGALAAIAKEKDPRKKLALYLDTKRPGHKPRRAAQARDLGFLQGELLHDLLQQYPDQKLAVDTKGSVYWVKTGVVKVGAGKNDALALGLGFASKDECDQADLKKIVADLLARHPGAALKR